MAQTDKEENYYRPDKPAIPEKTEREQCDPDPAGYEIRFFAEDSVRDMTPIELPDRKEVYTCYPESYPTGECDRMEHEFHSLRDMPVKKFSREQHEKRIAKAHLTGNYDGCGRNDF